MARNGTEHPRNTEEVHATNKQVEVEVPPKVTGIHYHTQTQVVARSKSDGSATRRTAQETDSLLLPRPTRRRACRERRTHPKDLNLLLVAWDE